MNYPEEGSGKSSFLPVAEPGKQCTAVSSVSGVKGRGPLTTFLILVWSLLSLKIRISEIRPDTSYYL